MDTLHDYMYDDIDKAIKEAANYLVALGLSTYTENLGGLYCGDLKNNLGDHYIEFIKKYFPSPYAAVDTKLKTLSKGGLYKVVRCGLVHEYFMKVESTVTISGVNQASCGIVYDTSKKPSLEFIVDKYFEDFKNAFERYRDDLLGTINKPPIKILQTNFDNAINGMPESPFSPSSGLTRESGRGLP